MTIELRPEDDPVRIKLPATGTGARSARSRDRTRRIVIGASAALVVTGLVLAIVGINEVRSSTAGKRVDPTSDPTEPGFEAFVTPTPAMMVLQEHGGELASVALLFLGAGDAGGTVVLVPPGTLGDYGGYGSYRLVDQYEGAGAEGVLFGVQRLLDLSVPETLVVDDAQLARLVASVAPLDVVNPDEVEAADGRLFAAGPLSLDRDDVAPYLGARREGETDLNRTARAELVWRAWLAALRSEPTATPGERDAGIGRFLTVLAAGSAVVQTLPVEEADGDPVSAQAFATQPEEMAALVANSVPLPTGHSPGNRARVRLLNGTTDPAAIGLAAQALVRELAEITVLGNAEQFGLKQTEVAYTDRAFRDVAERLAAALGGAEVVREERTPATADVIDITVRIGADFTEGSDGDGG